jgi:hypothetical protein
MLVASAALSSNSAFAGTGTAATSGGQVSFEFPDVVLDGSGLCFEAPISASATVKPNTEWYVNVNFRQPGTVPLSSTGRIRGLNSGSATGTIQICPSDGVGRMLVEGEFTTLEYDEPYTNAKVPIATEFTISKTPSVATISRVKSGSSGTQVSGKVTTESAKYGVVTTYGDVVLEYRPGRQGRWKPLGKGYTAKEGFTVQSRSSVPVRSELRVRFLGNDFALASQAVR